MKYTFRTFSLHAFVMVMLCLSVVSCNESGTPVPPEQESETEKEPEKEVRSLTADLIKLAKNDPYRLWICAHRSNTRKAKVAGIPENSIPAVEYAVECGIDMIEVDGRATKDGVIVNVHNETIDATTNGSGKVSAFTYEQLCGYRLKGSKGVTEYKVPTFKEVLEAAKDRIYVCVDVKEPALLPEMFEIAKELGMQDQMCYFAGTAAKLQNSDVVANAGAILFPWVSSVANINTMTTRYGENLHFVQFDINNKALAQIVTAVNEAGLTGFANHLNSADTDFLNGKYDVINMFIDNKIQFVQTDCGDKISDYLKEKGLR
jgi:hypothetical protein